MDTLLDLVNASKRLGMDSALVQGGGGNTSLKTTEHMWIKASGCTLDSVTEQKGFVAVDHKKICAELNDVNSEEAYTALLKNQTLDLPNIGTGRPSIETGLHALLGSAVLHSHSVWMNLFACAANGKELLQKHFPKMQWVPYTAPGVPLMKAIQQTTKNEITTLLLQNHGLVVSAPTLAQAETTHSEINELARHIFKLSTDAYNAFNKSLDADAAHVLFPDQAVYLLNESLKNSEAGIETLKAYSFIRHTLEAAGIDVHYLTENEANFLLDMESEKYRQKAATA